MASTRAASFLLFLLLIIYLSNGRSRQTQHHAFSLPQTAPLVNLNHKIIVNPLDFRYFIQKPKKPSLPQEGRLPIFPYFIPAVIMAIL